MGHSAEGAAWGLSDDFPCQNAAKSGFYCKFVSSRTFKNTIAHPTSFPRGHCPIPHRSYIIITPQQAYTGICVLIHPNYFSIFLTLTLSLTLSLTLTLTL